jgi:hypothetical protein
MVVKQPQDHKKKTEDSNDQEFRYTIGDKELIIPPFSKSINAGFLRKNRNLPMQDFVFLLLENILDEEQLELFDTMNLDEMNEFGKKWQEESGIELPESSAS